MVWSVLLLGVLVGQAWAAHYVSADDCDWRTGPSSPEVALRCRLQALRTGPDSTNFSLIQPDHTTSLTVLCSALFTESHLGNATFSSLRSLRALHLEQCKISEVPERAFAGLTELRNLTVRTYNGDWGGAVLGAGAAGFGGAHLRQLRSLNLTHNALETVAGLGCLGALSELDMSHNRLRQLDDGVLAALGSLRSLRLRHNRLDRLAPAALAGLAQLQLLDLSHNQLSGGLPPRGCLVAQISESCIYRTTHSAFYHHAHSPALSSLSS
ncbi:hypothetical protein MTO96_049589 [Rhipicephalus appendiculatus]